MIQATIEKFDTQIPRLKLPDKFESESPWPTFWPTFPGDEIHIFSLRA